MGELCGRSDDGPSALGCHESDLDQQLHPIQKPKLSGLSFGPAEVLVPSDDNGVLPDEQPDRLLIHFLFARMQSRR